jgi:hypothetical protein
MPIARERSRARAAGTCVARTSAEVAVTSKFRILGPVALMTIAACAQRSVALAPDSMDQLHAAVLADAEAATEQALLDASRALPPMDAPAEREGAVASTSVGATSPVMEEEAPPKPAEPSTEGSKAKSPPPTGPSGMRPPLSASEAAERADQPGQPAQGAPSSSASAPAPVSPKAPPELWNPPSSPRP